jgi:hypothetical protein
MFGEQNTFFKSIAVGLKGAIIGAAIATTRIMPMIIIPATARG